MNNIEIVKVNSKKLLKAFIDFPHDLYQGDTYYVPEIYLGQQEIHNPKKNPYFDVAEVCHFLAYQNNKIVGRISAHLSHNYNKYHNCNIGLFGFFDVINDQKVANALFDTANNWLREKKVDSIMGPLSFSLTTDTGGLLIEGYDSSPMIMMTYNAPYYKDLVEHYGFEKEMDLLAYIIYTKDVSDRSVKMEKLLSQRLEKTGITIRKLNLKDFDNEVKRLKVIYDKAWEKNWGFVPPTDAEFQHLAGALKLLVDTDFAYIALDGNKPIGFFLSLPNINEITKGFKKGRLFPFNIFKLLLNKKKVKNVRILTLGVIEEYRNRGIEAVFYAKNIIEAKNRGLDAGEASWILENNPEMVKGAEKLNGELYKRYRVYKKSIV